jgi:hypothetical protein
MFPRAETLTSCNIGNRSIKDTGLDWTGLDGMGWDGTTFSTDLFNFPVSEIKVLEIRDQTTISFHSIVPFGNRRKDWDCEQVVRAADISMKCQAYDQFSTVTDSDGVQGVDCFTEFHHRALQIFHSEILRIAS